MKPMKQRLPLFICGVLAVWGMLGGFGSASALDENVSETTLHNGLKVILLENHKAPVVTVQIWYRAGARSDPWGKTGRAHVFEHMMFKGTEKVSGQEFTRIIQENGGNYNAFTSYDYAAYFANLSSGKVEIPLRLEADRMQNLTLKENEFQTERMVVMEERRMRTEDDPRAQLSEQMQAAAFMAQPYHWPVIGWMDDLARLTLEDIREFYRSFYTPANAFLVIVGDFKEKEVMPLIERTFGAVPKKPAPAHYRYKDPNQAAERRVTLRKQAQLPSIQMGYRVPNLLEDDSYVLEVIAAVLSSGKSSRLYKELVLDKHLVLAASADHSLLTIDPGLFTLSAEPLPNQEVSNVEMALREQLERLQKDPVDEAELEKAKNQLEAQFLYGQDSLFYQAMLLARFEIVSNWREIGHYLPSIRRVSSSDILRVSKRYFIPENGTVGILLPLPFEEREREPRRPSPH